MRSSGQTRSDLMALRALISNGVSTVTGKIDALESSLAPVATSGSYDDLTDAPTLSAVATNGNYSDLNGKPTLGALASQDSIAHSQVSDWDSATSEFAVKTETQTISIAASDTYGLAVKLSRRDNLIICFIAGTANSIPKGAWATIATITDDRFIPAEQTPYQTLVPQNKANQPFLVRVTTGGAVQINPAYAVLTGFVNACIFYFAA